MIIHTYELKKFKRLKAMDHGQYIQSIVVHSLFWRIFTILVVLEECLWCKITMPLELDIIIEWISFYLLFYIYLTNKAIYILWVYFLHLVDILKRGNRLLKNQSGFFCLQTPFSNFSSLATLYIQLLLVNRPLGVYNLFSSQLAYYRYIENVRDNYDHC